MVAEYCIAGITHLDQDPTLGHQDFAFVKLKRQERGSGRR